MPILWLDDIGPKGNATNVRDGCQKRTSARPAGRSADPSIAALNGTGGGRHLDAAVAPGRAAYQLQLPLSGGYWWGLLARPEVEKRAE